ncbi:unnamed protein product [Chilo suppressalis]|uniref:MULE transposase domain-containing protein n=1 Tax=Chilo suppressalis TaxID=168631 RepID=A0ABN8B4W1_CHISP|nr:unnamed protein product [Chilo suppressalis]
MLKDKVCKSTKPIPHLYEKAVYKNKGLDLVTPLPPLSSVQHCLYDISNKGLCVNKTTFSKMEDVVLPAQFENFILADYYYEESRIIIFCPPSTRNKLGEINVIMGDGTFKCYPKPFYQLYSIFGDIGSSVETTKVTPLLFALLPNKKEVTYNVMFCLFKSQLPDFDPKIYSYNCDFKQGANNAIQMVYLKVEVRGCFYHWHRALWRKAKLLNLKSKGQKRIVGLTAARPLLLEDNMPDGFHYIISEGTALKTDKFFKYVESFWKIRYFETILCFGLRFRANNALEGFHAKINKKINKNSINLLWLLSVLSTIRIAK